MPELATMVETLSIEQIPFEQLETSLGIPKEVFTSHSQYEDIVFALTHLTCGRSMITPVVEFSEYINGKYRFSSARFSLRKNELKKLKMIIYPITDQIRFENEFDLDNNEIAKLCRGEVLSKEIDLYHDGERIDSLLQLIPGTNTTVVVPKFSIIIPENLGQVQQTVDNIEKLRNGGQITVSRPDGQVFNVQLCLYSPNMINVSENFDRLRQQTTQPDSQQMIAVSSDVPSEDHIPQEINQTSQDKPQTTSVIKR